VKERLFLDRIALHPANVTPGNVEFSALVVANLAHAGLALKNGAAMSASETANAIAFNRLVKLAFADVLVEDVPERRHRKGNSLHIF
jgi:hypothetical protein